MQPNPLREGLDQERVPEPSCLVIFGASGDLTQRKLIPGLYSLAHDGLLPSGQTIIGFARAEMSDEQFRETMKKACNEHARTRPVDDAIWENFARGLFYVQGEFADAAAFDRLKARLEEFDGSRGTGGRRIYYLAVPPDFFATISTTVSFMPRFRMVSIIPGIESRAPERTETSSGRSLSPSFLFTDLSILARAVSTCELSCGG